MFSSIIDFYLVPGHSLWDVWVLHPLQMAVPLLSPLVAEEEMKITQRSGGAPEPPKPSWASPTIAHSLQDTPTGPGEAGRCPTS